MHKYMMAALFALVFAIPGTAKVDNALRRTNSIPAQATAPPCSVEQVLDSPEMDPALVEAILRAAAEQCEYDYATLNTMYEDGTLVIDKVPGGYRVSDGGGLLIVLGDESI